MGDVGFEEIVIIAIVAVLCFGKDLPLVARKAARALGKVRRYLLDIKEDVVRQIPMDEFEVARDVKNTIDDEIYEPKSDPPSALAKSEPPPAEPGGTAPPSPPAP